MKGMAALVTTTEGALRPARDWLGFLPRRQKPAASSPAAKPPQREAEDPSALQPTIYRFIIRHSMRQQLLLLGLTLVSFPFLYYSLNLPKTILNFIQGKHTSQDILGFQFDPTAYLMLLCAASEAKCAYGAPALWTVRGADCALTERSIAIVSGCISNFHLTKSVLLWTDQTKMHHFSR